jgi:hypothetical protein
MHHKLHAMHSYELVRLHWTVAFVGGSTSYYGLL